jgi:NDP-sugar pyrophosphorylase family protein
MGVKYPKCLVKVGFGEAGEQVVLTDILEKIRPYANNIYVCCNNYYKDDFQKYERSETERNVIYDNIKFLYFDSVDKSQSYPKGNGETLYQLLESINITEKAFVIWSDIIIKDARIFEEMYNLQYGNDFLIPTVYEEDPYAYLIINKGAKTGAKTGSVTGFGYRRDAPVEMGFHDQCIFLVNTSIVKDKLGKKIGCEYSELNFLDIVNDIEKVAYYETKYPLKSFNTFNDINGTADK